MDNWENKVLDELNLRGYSNKTNKAYLFHIKKFIDSKLNPREFLLKIIKQGKSKLEVTLTEGRKRQIKKMFAAVDHSALSIQRIAFGPLKLGTLKIGSYRELKRYELNQLNKLNNTKELIKLC